MLYVKPATCVILIEPVGVVQVGAVPTTAVGAAGAEGIALITTSVAGDGQVPLVAVTW